MEKVISKVTRFTDYDIYLFKEGRHYHLWEKLGSHLMEHNGKSGTYFAVWAPNANKVSVFGEFNNWDKTTHQLFCRSDESGIWEGFIPGIEQGAVYKYFITSQYHGYTTERGDPFAFLWETPPQTASIVWDTQYYWNDDTWLEHRKQNYSLQQPFSI